MAQIYNPWESPPSTDTLTGDLASFEINGTDDPEAATESTGESNHGMAMQQALQVISQQAELIATLMKTLGKAQ